MNASVTPCVLGLTAPPPSLERSLGRTFDFLVVKGDNDLENLREDTHPRKTGIALPSRHSTEPRAVQCWREAGLLHRALGRTEHFEAPSAQGYDFPEMPHVERAEAASKPEGRFRATVAEHKKARPGT